MKYAKASGTLGLLVLAGMASPIAAAADSAWYVGASVGQSRATMDDQGISDGLLGGGFTTTSISENERDLGFKVLGGYKFSKYFALEGGYFDLGKFDFTATTVPAGTLNGSIKPRGLNFDGIGILPFTDKFSAFGRVGVIYAEAKDSFSGTGAVNVLDPDRSKRATNYKLGLGLQYDFTESFGMRAEAERYRIDDAVGNKGDIDLISLGLVYRFGGAAAAPELAPAVAAPPPVVMVPPPQKPVPAKVSFSADSLFAFDKETVTPAGKQSLDALAADLKGSSFEVITVTGYTDRIGSPTYNMDLSTRRAEAVKTYLMESAGIPASKITARGLEETNPVTKPGECMGKEATKKLIACLQPDRRVEVEVSGTK